MGQLVPQRSIEIALVGPQQDCAGARKSDCGAPSGGTAGCERVEVSPVGDDDQLQGAGGLASQSGPLSGASGLLGQLDSEIALCGPGDGRHLPHTHGGGLSLNCRETFPAKYEEEKPNHRPAEGY